jgi:hypothetical protein
MPVLIEYESQAFPSSHPPRWGRLETSWDELLWAAITVGRPSTYHVFRHGPASFHEAIFRLALVRMAVEQDSNNSLRRTDAYSALDPTEKGMVSYFLGMTLCKLFSARLLLAPWLLHLDVFRHHLNPVVLGRSRPDLVGQDADGNWLAFESKGRSSAPSSEDKGKAKSQALRLVSIGGVKCTLNVGSFAYFQNEVLEFYWRDPLPDEQKALELPMPEQEWRFYYEPAFRLTEDLGIPTLAAEREMADVKIEIHPEIRKLLGSSDWQKAKKIAQGMGKSLVAKGYQPDGLKVTAGESWARRFEPRDRS